MAFAPDALTPLGGYPGDETKARELFVNLDQTKTKEDFVAAAQCLVSRADCAGKIGVVGFCYGGSKSFTLAAAVPFYGNMPPASDALLIKAPLQIHFAEVDERINAAWPAYEQALRTAGVSYSAYQYPGTQHGFNNEALMNFTWVAQREG